MGGPEWILGGNRHAGDSEARLSWEGSDQLRKKFRVVAEYMLEVFVPSLRVRPEASRVRLLRVSSGDAFDAVFSLSLLIADDILINFIF